VPAEPSRKRATVWREVKKLGAVYLRDGVCVLPERDDTLAALQTLARTITELDGQATLVTRAVVDTGRAESIEAQFTAARAEEYADVAREAEQLLAHVARETAHRGFTVGDVEDLKQDLSKLKRWLGQIRARDYFPNGAETGPPALLEECARAIGRFLEESAHTA
jgi:hypothetical protein